VKFIPETANRQDWPRLVAQALNEVQRQASALISGALGGVVVRSAGTSYTEATTSGELVVLVTGAAVNVALPTAVGNTAKMTFKLTVAGTMTLTALGGQTIDGGATAAISTRYTSLTIVSDGTNWQIV